MLQTVEHERWVQTCIYAHRKGLLTDSELFAILWTGVFDDIHVDKFFTLVCPHLELRLPQLVDQARQRSAELFDLLDAQIVARQKF